MTLAYTLLRDAIAKVSWPEIRAVGRLGSWHSGWCAMLPAVAQIDSTLAIPSPAPSGGAEDAGDGTYGTIEELAAAEKINPSYVSRILRLRLLAPDIVEAEFNGKHSPKLTLATLMRSFSNNWPRHQSLWGCAFEADRKSHARTKYYRV